MPPPHPRPRNILSPVGVQRRQCTVPLPIDADSVLSVVAIP